MIKDGIIVIKLIDNYSDINVNFEDDEQTISVNLTDYNDEEVRELIQENKKEIEDLKEEIENIDIPTKTSELTNDSDFVSDERYVHTDNNYTNEDKNKLASLENYDDTEIKAEIQGIENNKADKSEIPDVSDFVTKDVNDLTNYELKVNTGTNILMTIDSSNYVVTLQLKNSLGAVLNTQMIDLPLETMVVSGSYDNVNKKIILTLKNGNTIDIPVADLVSGLQSEITSSNKLSSDLVDDTNNINKFVTNIEKEVWNNKSDFSGSYNDLTDKPTIPVVPTNISAFVNDVGYLTSHQDISGKLDTSKVKDTTSTTAGDVYDVTYINDMIGDIETILTRLTTGSGV